MNKSDKLETQTTLLEEATTTTTKPETSSATKSGNGKDREFKNLIAAYTSLINNRTIPYPVAYQLQKELGHGLQGIVFLATRHGARGCITHHALKLFAPRIYSSAARYWTDMGRIARQVSALQPVNNINLVSRDFYDECNGIGYMIMQAIDGIDLKTLLDNRYLKIAHSRSSPEEWTHFNRVIFRTCDSKVTLQTGLALYIMRNVLRGVASLHNRDFVHGDIKLTNIMIDVQGTVKLVDFGRAARVGEPINILLGSPVYMAPELHRREPSRVQSDIFSIGLVGLEMLAGHKIFECDEKDENELLELKNNLVKNIENYLPQSVLQNAKFLQVLKQFLAPNIADRFSSAKQAESGHESLVTSRQWFANTEREIEYGHELETFMAKFIDPEKGALNPHFPSENITAFLIT